MDAKVSCAPAGIGSACYIISGGPLAAGRLISEAGSGAALFCCAWSGILFFCISFPPVTAVSYDLFTCSVFLKIQN